MHAAIDLKDAIADPLWKPCKDEHDTAAICKVLNDFSDDCGEGFHLVTPL
jgi:hypothetical protein